MFPLGPSSYQRLKNLEHESEYVICASKEGIQDVATLGWVTARSREQAVEAWGKQNPTKAKTLEESSEIKIYALVYGGGI